MYIKEGYLIFFIDNYNSHKAVYRSSTCDIITAYTCRDWGLNSDYFTKGTTQLCLVPIQKGAILSGV